MNSLFSVAEADREVIVSLLHEIIRRIEMSKLLQDQDGNLYIAHKYESVSADEAKEMVADFQSEVAVLQNFLSAATDANGNQVVPADQITPGEPATTTAVEQPQTATPDAGIPTPPADQPATPSADTPAPADPNAPPTPEVNQPAVPDQTAPADPIVQPPLQ